LKYKVHAEGICENTVSYEPADLNVDLARWRGTGLGRPVWKFAFLWKSKATFLLLAQHVFCWCFSPRFYILASTPGKQIFENQKSVILKDRQNRIHSHIECAEMQQNSKQR